MKYFNLFFISFFIFSTISCENKDSAVNKANELDFYISAISGLNYRALPKGKILGKFLLNTKVSVVERTGVFQEIKDGENLLQGEWVGVKKTEDTVYVFDGFLSKEKIFLDLEVTKVMEDYYNDNFGKGTKLVTIKNDSVLDHTYYSIPESEEDYSGFLMGASMPVRVNDSSIVYGDLNNDGLDDMIVLVNTEGGGGGGNVWWVDYFVYLKADEGYQFKTVQTNWEMSGCTGFFGIDKIENNVIYGESTCYAEEDGRCCPSLSYLTQLKFENNDFTVLSTTELKGTKE